MGKLLYRCQPPQCKAHPQWAKNAVIYEVNTRQFSPEGNFRGVADQLDRLKNLGVDLIWFMPVYPIGEERRKGSMGSYYSVRDYQAVNPEFGTFEEFKALVVRIHDLGMRVILDWIPNHTSRDAVWVTEHPDWYKWDEVKNEIETPWDWEDTAQLDYDNPEMRQGMVEAMQFWLRNTLIDGFRVDMAMLEPIEFWNETVPVLEKTLQQMRDGRELFMLAEAEGPQFHSVAFDATYAWELHHLLVDIAQGKVGNHPVSALRRKIVEYGLAYPADAYRLIFTSNHDENSWNKSEFDRFGLYVKQMAVLTYILPGMPLIYNGQEAGSTKQLPFFEKDCIEWEGLQTGEYTRFYQNLNELRHTHPALWSGEQGGDVYQIENTLPDRILALKRKVGERIVIALFNPTDQHADLEFHDADFNGTFHELGRQKLAELRSGAHFWIPPHGFFVYYR